MIRPVVEFFPLERVESDRTEGAYSIFDKDRNTYNVGLYNELSDSRGVYIFYDSSGHAIYAGKAERQSLWKEANRSYRKEPGKTIRRIYSASHPKTNVPFVAWPDQIRPVVQSRTRLCDLAWFVSAYEVSKNYIHDVEALLIRAFANDLINRSMENFRVPSRRRRRN